MEIFAKIVDGLQPLTFSAKGFQPLNIFAKRSILDVWQGSEYASDMFERCSSVAIRKDIRIVAIPVPNPK